MNWYRFAEGAVLLAVGYLSGTVGSWFGVLLTFPCIVVYSLLDLRPKK